MDLYSKAAKAQLLTISGAMPMAGFPALLDLSEDLLVEKKNG